MVLLSITGLMKLLLIIIGVSVILRFVGRLMIAKRNIDAHKQSEFDRSTREEALRKSQQNMGKTTISKVGKSKLNEGDFVDFEEVD